MNDLDAIQCAALKNSWIALISAISDLTSLPADGIVDSDYGNELFCLIGYDNPDILLLRWLRARKWDVNAAVQQIIDLLKWRLEWGIQTILAKSESEISVQEIMVGKGYFMGHDKEGHLVCYIHVKEHIKGQFPYENTEQLAVLGVETYRKLLKTPMEMITVVIDMTGFSLKNIDYQLAKFFIGLVQNQYPESLSLGIVLNAPWLFNTCWSVVKRWLDPVVESKIHFIKNEADLTEYIDSSSIPERLSGVHPDFQYIPPTAEEESILVALRADNQGKTNAQKAYCKAARSYLNITLRWAHGDDNLSLLSERETVTKQLRDAFEKLVPYIRTRTHYHRTGDIDEPIFDIAYKKLRTTDEDVAYF